MKFEDEKIPSMCKQIEISRISDREKRRKKLEERAFRKREREVDRKRDREKERGRKRFLMH